MADYGPGRGRGKGKKGGREGGRGATGNSRNERSGRERGRGARENSGNERSVGGPSDGFWNLNSAVGGGVIRPKAENFNPPSISHQGGNVKLVMGLLFMWMHCY